MGLLLEVDGSAAPQGRAFDALAAVEYRPAPRWTIAAGYRTIEGGADVDEVYTFAWLNAAIARLRFEFSGRASGLPSGSAGRSSLMKHRVGSSDPPQDLVSMGDGFSVIAWSPDGRWLAHDHPDGLSLVGSEDGTHRLLAANTRLRAIAWSGDGRTIYGPHD